MFTIHRLGLLENAKPEGEVMVRCSECKTREATQDDGLCDHCRFMRVLDNIVAERKVEKC